MLNKTLIGIIKGNTGVREYESTKITNRTLLVLFVSPRWYAIIRDFQTYFSLEFKQTSRLFLVYLFYENALLNLTLDLNVNSVFKSKRQ